MIVEKQDTLGGFYFACNKVEVDIVIVYADEASETFNTMQATQIFWNTCNIGVSYKL